MSLIMKAVLNVFLLLSLLVFATGCSSLAKQWKSLISDGEPKKQMSMAQAQAAPAPTTYSNQRNMTPPVYRDYNRMTKQEFTEQARVDSRAGSLWVMEGQGSYLFAQNVVRQVGAPLNVQIIGDPKNQLEQKAQTIKDLLTQLENRRNAIRRKLAGQAAPAQAAPANPDAGAQANAVAPGAAGGAQGDNAAAAPSGVLSVQNVPTRITERMVDGNYRVQGMQPFMIEGREYKVIVSGIVKSEDFNENGISATALLDPKFDIVSSKNSELR